MSTTTSSLSLPAPASYFPVIDNQYSTRAGLTKLGHDFGNGQQDAHLFQFDNQFSEYRNNKLQVREEALHEHVCAEATSESQLAVAARFILEALCHEHPNYFCLDNMTLNCALTQDKLQLKDDYSLANNVDYKNLFDALALQVQEDICLMQVDGSTSNLIAAHLCAPNHWSARDKLGMDMFALHDSVPEFLKENREPNQLMKGLYNKSQAYVRFAWGITEQPILNQHPNLTTKHPAPSNNKVWMRIERQVISPIPKTKMILFTIRTYFRDCDSLEKQQRFGLISAINSMSDDTLNYKNINKTKILEKLN